MTWTGTKIKSRRGVCIHPKGQPEYLFKNNFSSGHYSGGNKSYGYKYNYSHKNGSSDSWKHKPGYLDSSSINNQSELFKVLLHENNGNQDLERHSLCRSYSEKVDGHKGPLQKLLEPSSISWSLYDGSEDRNSTENEDNSSEGDYSDLSSELEHEEDFNELDISERNHGKEAKDMPNPKFEYIKYLNSINSGPLNLEDHEGSGYDIVKQPNCK